MLSSNDSYFNASNENTLPSPPSTHLEQVNYMTNDQYKFCVAIIRNLKRHRDASPFLKPVDYVKLNVPDYPTIVQHPMDLCLVDSKLTSKLYSHVDEFISDVRLIFNNCFKFNGPEAMISVLCQNVESAFEKSLRQMPPSPTTVNMNVEKELIVKKEPSPPLSQHNSPPPQDVVESRPKREIHCPSKDYPQTFTTQRKLSLANKTTQMKYCFGVLKEFKKSKYRDQIYPFLYPVDPIALNIPDYPTIVKHPMDLSTIENKLLNDEYKGPEGFGNDVKLMFHNCYLYNPPNLPIYEAAQQMEKVFDEKWEKRPLEDEVNNKKATPTKKSQKRKVIEEEEEEEVEEEEEEEDDKLAELERHLQTITQQIESMKKPNSKKSTPPTKKPLKRKRIVKKKEVSSDEEEESEDEIEYSHQQKIVLSTHINGLSNEKLAGVVEIIQANMPILQNDGNTEIELDMESLNTKTLYQLHNYVFPEDPIGMKSETKRSRGRKPNPNKRNTPASGKKRKREHFSEVATERKIKALEATLLKFERKSDDDSCSSSESESDDDDVSDSSSSSDSD